MKRALSLALIPVALFLVFVFSMTPNALAISLVNVATSSLAGSGTQATTTMSVTSGNLVVLFCRHGTTFVDPTSATDTIGNVFTNFGISSNSSAGAMTGYWALASGTNASDIVSCNFASSVAGRVQNVLQYSGVATSSPLDATSTNATTTNVSQWSAGPITTHQTNEVIVAGINPSAGTSQAGLGYTIRATGTATVAAEDQIVSAIQTAVSSTASTTVAGNWLFLVGTFKAAAATSTPDALFFAGD